MNRRAVANESRGRVLHVLAEIGRSGAESMLLASRSEFLEGGYESDVVSTGDSVGPMAPEFESAGFGVHHIPFEKTPLFFLRMYRVMRRGHYDVIHLHTERANVWFGLIALSVRPRRVLRTIHNVFGFQGGLRRRRGLQRRALQRLGVVHVSCGPAVLRNERGRFGLRTRLVPNWYDSRRFTPPTAAERRQARELLGIAEDETVLVTTGNCSSVKNHGALIAAIARLPAGSRPLYLHAGIEESDRSERTHTQELGVAEHVRFLGGVDDVRLINAASDLFAMPSLYEGFSVAALEALAMGLPCLFTDVDGLADLRATYSGLAYAEPTVESLAGALGELLAQTPEQLRSHSAEYAEVTRRTFGIEAGVERYLEIYRGSDFAVRQALK